MHPIETPHPGDATLLAVAHGGLPATSAAEVLSHLDACELCEQRLSEFLKREREIELLLSELDHPMPRLVPVDFVPRATDDGLRRGLLAASLAIVCAVGAATAITPGSPVYRWFRRQFTPAHAPPAVRQQPPPPSGPAEQATAGISLPGPSDLTVELRWPQAAGVLDITVVEGTNLTVRSVGGGVAYALEERRLLIDNRTPARQYTIEVPRGMRHLRVVLAGRTTFQKEGDSFIAPRAPDATGRYRIPLGPGSESGP